MSSRTMSSRTMSSRPAGRLDAHGRDGGRSFGQAASSFGGHVLVTEDFEIGLRVGWGLTDSSPDFFTNVGIGWQL